MVDKITNPALAANMYANTAKAAELPGAEPRQGPSFGEMVKNAAVKGIQTIRAGEAASAAAVTGDASLPEVVQAVTAAELTLQTVVAVRDKLVAAYQEIMRMPI